VSANEDEGVRGDVHYVTVEQDPDQSPEGCLSASADEGKPGSIINLCVSFQLLNLSLFFMCIYVQELIKTLVAWFLSTYDLLLACQDASGYALKTRYKSSDVRHSRE
jgi:hypothetical protein